MPDTDGPGPRPGRDRPDRPRPLRRRLPPRRVRPAAAPRPRCGGTSRPSTPPGARGSGWCRATTTCWRSPPTRRRSRPTAARSARPAAARSSRTCPAGFAAGVLLNMQDDPRHQHIRKLVTPAVRAASPGRHGAASCGRGPSRSSTTRCAAGDVRLPRRGRGRAAAAGHRPAARASPRTTATSCSPGPNATLDSRRPRPRRGDAADRPRPARRCSTTPPS